MDFNRSPLPPCAFADRFVCPFAPPGNTLVVAIAAGERNLRWSDAGPPPEHCQSVTGTPGSLINPSGSYGG